MALIFVIAINSIAHSLACYFKALVHMTYAPCPKLPLVLLIKGQYTVCPQKNKANYVLA